MRFTGQCWRAHHPMWSFQPASGEGAAIHGARFNPKGTPALYLGLTLDTAVVEASQGFGHKFEPLTLCMYEVDCEHIADLRGEDGRAAAGVAYADMACGWTFDLAQGREPPSWAVARRLIAAGAAGIAVPSFAIGARPDMGNLVLWRWGDALPHKVSVHDPGGRLPASQASRGLPSATGKDRMP